MCSVQSVASMIVGMDLINSSEECWKFHHFLSFLFIVVEAYLLLGVYEPLKTLTYWTAFSNAFSEDVVSCSADPQYLN